MAKVIDSYEDFQPASRTEWREWLRANHADRQGVWLVYYKKSSGLAQVSYDDAVEEALCFGWIDSLPRKLDDARSKLLFTPRKAKSVWSALNKRRIESLLADGLIEPAGMAKVEAAKLDGSWNSLDDAEALKIPTDLKAGLGRERAAAANFDAFAPSTKKAILSWLSAAKRDETRRARIKKIARMAARNLRANFDRE